MEGVIDAAMRARLTDLGGYTRCVTEFVRVSDVLLPERVFHRLCPELLQDARTPSGVPVYVQLLGSNAEALAVNAKRAVSLGALGIDLNFGCPAKTVNNSQGGSILLREPEWVHRIVATVRDAIPAQIPLTVKIRLGYDDASGLHALCRGIWQSGASELAIHARTKFDGYKPPAYWDLVKPVVEEFGASNTIINGEIWTLDDSNEAQLRSGCSHIMLGRGALSSPDLASRIVAGNANTEAMPWRELVKIVHAQFISSDCSSPRHVGNRTKQWLAYLRRSYPESLSLFQRLRTLHSIDEINNAFAAHMQSDLAIAC